MSRDEWRFTFRCCLNCRNCWRCPSDNILKSILATVISAFKLSHIWSAPSCCLSPLGTCLNSIIACKGFIDLLISDDLTAPTLCDRVKLILKRGGRGWLTGGNGRPYPYPTLTYPPNSLATCCHMMMITIWWYLLNEWWLLHQNIANKLN